MKKVLILFFLCTILTIQANAQDTTNISFDINLTWTAVYEDAGDSTSGAASGYDLRMSTDSMILKDNFETALQIEGLPVPSQPGTSESFVATIILDPETTYYFAIKVRDSFHNWSEVSNITSRTTLDTDAPGRVTDLTVTITVRVTVTQ